MQQIYTKYQFPFLNSSFIVFVRFAFLFSQSFSLGNLHLCDTFSHKSSSEKINTLILNSLLIKLTQVSDKSQAENVKSFFFFIQCVLINKLKVNDSNPNATWCCIFEVLQTKAQFDTHLDSFITQVCVRHFVVYFCRKLISTHRTYPLIKKSLSSLYINVEDFKKDDTYLMPPYSQKNKGSCQYQNQLLLHHIKLHWHTLCSL